MPVHTVRFIIDCTCVRVCECVRFACCIFHYAKIAYHFFFLGTFFRFLFAFFEMHSTQIARFGSCIFCVQNAIALGWIFQLCSISPPFAPHFNDIFGGFCRICLRGFNFNCLVRHSFIFFPYFAAPPLHFFLSTSSGRVHVVADFIFCKYSNYMCSLMATLCFEVLLFSAAPCFRIGFFLFLFRAYLCRVLKCLRGWRRLEFHSGCGHQSGPGVGRTSSSKDNYARAYFGSFSDSPEDAI